MVELVILDVNGTLFSLDAVTDRLDQIGLGDQLDVWFARILRDGFAAAAAGAFVAFPELAQHHLRHLADEHGRRIGDDDVDRIIGGFNEVDAHEDVGPGLRRLKDAGVTVTTMTNGTVDITRDFLGRHGLDGFVDATYDVESVARWKPAPEPYHHVLEDHGVQAGAAALLAVHPWDVQGAIHAGLAAAWVNRAGDRYPDGYARPTYEAGRFDAVVDLLLADSA